MSLDVSESGQLDWTNLSRTTFTCTLEFCGRLANADVNLATIGVGNAICSAFSFPAQGQLELSKSLSNLKGISSFSQVVWFGFGVKHVVRFLSETEQGATCVAICAALAIPRTSFQAAQVLRDLCQLQGAPPTLSPSVHQWANLVEVCTGVLTKSSFSRYYEGFVRLLVISKDIPRVPTSSKDIARALILLGQLSRRTLASATFVGGLSCAWLAAVAQCLLCLNIEIRDEKGRAMYRSATADSGAILHATFVRENQENTQSPPETLIHRTCFVSSGEELLHERVDLTNTPYRGPTRWATVLADTFPEFKARTPPLAKALKYLLSYVASQSKQYYSSRPPAVIDMDALPWLNWKGYGCLYHPRCTGTDFLTHAKTTFPELSFCVESGPHFQPAMYPLKDLVGCLEELSRSCSCIECKPTRAPRSESMMPQCSVRVVVTIVRLLLILAPVVISEDIPPSISALKQLYHCSPGLHDSAKTKTIRCQGLTLVLFIFTGRLPTAQMYPRISAASTAGVCVYYSLLKDVNLSPSEAMDIEVIPGHIKHREQLYNFVIDLDNPYSRSSRGWGLPGLLNDKVVLIAEEVEDNKALAASYQVPSSEEPPVYLGIDTLVEALRSFIRTSTWYAEDCVDLSGPGSPTCDWPFQFSIAPVKESTDKTSIPPSVEDLHSLCWSVMTWESWSLPRTAGGPHQQLEIQIARRDPLSLFLMLTHLGESYSKFPFKHKRNRLVISQMVPCPSCRVRMACWLWSKIASTPIDSRAVPFDQKGKRGSIREYYPNSTEGEIKFELFPTEQTSSLSNRAFKWFRRS